MTPQRLRRAAEILREEARSLKNDEMREVWGAALIADMDKRHDEMLSLAIELDIHADRLSRDHIDMGER